MKIVLFENQEKRRGKKDADMRGSLEIDGEKYWVDVWWNQHDTKGDYLRGNLKLQEEQSPQERNRSRNDRRDEEERPRGRGRERDEEPPTRGRRDDDEPPQKGRGRGGFDDMDDDVPF
jgi:hypothetical protein